jgi:predicted SAM-dependent methyltransferase
VGLTRANVGCGSIRPQKWANIDPHNWDIRMPARAAHCRLYRSAVMNHVLDHLDHHELVPALANVRDILQPGGVLRVMVPDLMEAFYAYQQHQEEWFPQDERTGDLDAKFCTYITWFGTQKSVFTRPYLQRVLEAAGFRDVKACRFQQTWSDDERITELDDRQFESIFMEGVAP